MTKDDGDRKVIRPNTLLREAREHKGLSHQEVAEAIGLPDPHTLGRWERGENFPRPHYRRKLCELLGKSLEELGLIPSERQDAQKEQIPYTHDDAPHDTAVTESEQENTQEYKYEIRPSFTSFIGREEEIARVCALVKRPAIRLVSILGPGGVGKTRLAREVARACQEHFFNKICLVSLAAVQDARLVLPTIAGELHLRESDSSTLLEDLQHFLQSKPTFLLILDNFEHLLETNSLIERLLARCPNLKVLVTSRTVLHLPGEQEFTLHPLPFPDTETSIDACLKYDAIQLFTQRAQARLDTFRATPENIPLIRQICAALDGLPLAIELAAARVKIFPLPDLLEEITESRLDLRRLTNESSPDSPQQHSLAETIAWSYDLLTEREQWLFRHLAVFPAGGTRAAAKKIWNASPFQDIDAISLLMSLLDKNMIRPVPQVPGQGQPFFLMLETIREYGLHLLHQKGELETAQQAFALYYLDLLETNASLLRGPQQKTLLTTLDQEHQNLSAALAWLLEHGNGEQVLAFCEIFGNFCGLRGYWNEEAYWLKATLDLPRTQAATSLRGKVLRRAGYLAYRLRNLSTAHRYLEESIAISQAQNDLLNLAGALSGLALVLYREENLSPIQNILERGVEAARLAENPWSLANVLASLGEYFLKQNQLDRAAQLLQESIALAREIGDKETLARLLNTTVSIEVARKQFERAAECAQESFTLANELGNKPLLALMLTGLADVALAQGDLPRAAELYEQRIPLATALNDKAAVALMQLKLSGIALQQGDLERAEKLAQTSSTFFRAKGDKPNASIVSNILTEIAQWRTQRGL